MRQLNPIESAFTRMNAAYPLTLVCVLQLDPGPDTPSLRSALDDLQSIHPMLHACISQNKGKYSFERRNPAVPVPLEAVSRTDGEQWLGVAKQELNTGFDHSSDPLMRVTQLVPDHPNGPSEIVLSFHHAMADAVSLVPILKSLLSALADPVQKDDGDLSKLRAEFTVAPSLKAALPGAFKIPGILLKLLPFMYRQIRDELHYRASAKHVQDSPVPQSSENDLMTLEFTEAETRRLVKWTRKHRLTLNNLIMACMLKTVNKHKHGDQKKLLHAVQFANLRPYLKPPVGNLEAGCFATLMRSNVHMAQNEPLQVIASRMDRQFMHAARKGDKFLFALLGDTIVKKTIRSHKERLGAAALSYAGPLHFEKQYGDIELAGIHAFISNNCLGAELAAFGKLLFGKLSLDLNYLAEETSRQEAICMAEDLKSMVLRTIQENEA